MFSPQIEWNCSECQSVVADRRKYCTDCYSMLTWTCIGSGKSEQRPWSEWRLTDESCIQHTAHDTEQIRQLYSMCEESLIRYRSHRKEQRTDGTVTSCLSPINLLVVTLWYLKHYHVERCISTELNSSPSTVNAFLREVIDILHSCVYPEFISLPVNFASKRTPHGPQRHHKLIVDSTCIAIPEPYDSDQRKAYYHSKYPTNYEIKIQIACDFNHRIVHASECYHGSVHDITVLSDSGLLEHVNSSVQIIADKEYIGEDYVVTLRKKSHERELTDEDKNFNRDINSARTTIENINQRLKTYAILGRVYRGAINDFEKITKIIQVISALCNMNLKKHPIRK
ncbi:unnamed protein product [Adineta ricciae]|uniref:DDE Tnp4 domain-containing protein n=1 Tax=Adineta ricciae TaxID=249248 RepID=A0A815WB65_ADIRI|nr:unnamed protein product [Adineta ricciae]CAF1598015.1 unnamed protein product [Adineta ricciae]